MLLFHFEKYYWYETNFKSQEKPNEKLPNKNYNDNILM